MSNIKLSHALKLKNKLIRELSQLQGTVLKNNSVIDGNVREYSPLEILPKIDEVTKDLIEVKKKISKANESITEEILTLGELKSQIAFLRKIDTKQGLVEGGYRSTVATKYTSELTQKFVDDKVKEIEKKIETIQSKLDNHNYTTTISLDIKSTTEDN